MRRWQQRVYAILTVFVMLFCNIDFSSLAEKSGGGGYNLPPTICGLEEHEHTDDCYESILICGLEESEAEIVKRYQSNFKVHHHSDQCKDSSGNIACGMIEGLYYHQHNEYCRDAEGNLVCGLETKKPHEHTEECYLQEQKLICEREETDGHQHGEDCYESRSELICETAEDPGHHHDDSCYTQRKELTCGIEEDAGHHHSEECWQDRKELTCEQEESEEHTHTEECYTIYHDLACGKEERDGHVHTDDCYTVFNDLTCGEEERDGHSHTDACYRTWDELICEQEEVEAHHHDESCYETVQTLICDKPTTTHHHTAACYNEAGFVTCGKLEVPAFTCSEDNWVEEVVSEGHRHTKACYETQLTCGIPEHTHTDECYPAATEEPTEEPTPGVTEEPTAEPTEAPDETELPTEESTAEPTETPEPTEEPTPEVTDEQTAEPTVTPEETESPTEDPKEEHTETPEPTEEPTPEVTEEPTVEPTEEPTPGVTEEPTAEPTEAPDETEQPTEEPTVEPTETPAPTEESTPEVTEEPAAEPTETPEETDLPTEEPTAESTETPEPTEEPTNEPVEITIPSAEDAPIQVSITFMSDAGIPEGTELVVTENGSAAENAESPSVRKMAVKAAPMKLASVQDAPEEERYVTIPSLTTWNIGDKAPEIVLFEKTVDISLVSDGEEIEPNPDAEIMVTAVLPGIEDGQIVEVRHVTENGAVLLESTNNAGVVTFKTNSFSLFTFTSFAQKIFSKTTESLEIRLFGRSSDQNATLENAKIDENSLPDGFSIIDTTSSPQNSNLWMTLQRVKDIALGKLESIDLYAVVDGKLAGIVKENVRITDILRLNLGNYSSFALVRDSGLRNKVEELGNVILSGLMPKNGTAEATDVTKEYENFVVGRSVDFIGGNDEELGGEGVSKEGEADGETHTIAAYDISIINDGEEYQPDDKPIEVTIKDKAIATAVANGNAISLWHVLDDGTAEKVENFTITGDTVVFDATGFSVYVVTETTVEKILTAADGKVYKITVTYDGSAQIPEDAKLIVEEKNEEAYLADTIKTLKTKEDYLLYRKFLDISFVTADGEVIEPATPVSVKIELLDVEAGADKLQVVHFGNDGAEKVESQANNNAVVTFTSGEFSVFGIGNVLEPLATTETEETKIELLGFGNEKELTETDTPEVEEGLEVLGSYSVENEGQVWIKAELKDDVELFSMESVAIYSVNNDDEEVVELAGMGTITELPTTEFAVVKDSGYRHLSFELNTDEDKTVSLDGMMPKAAEATAVDVTENYTDHEFVESAPIENEKTASVDDEATGNEKQEVEEEQQQEEAEGPSHTTNRVTLVAYDISITNSDADYQPDEEHPVEVTINDSRILSGNNIELWHIRDDGTEERVEEFTVENGKIEFEAVSFSTYAIVYNITTYYQTSSGETYKIIVEYSDDAGLPEGVELRVAEVDAEEYLADTAAVLGVDDSYLLYKKFLDISFMAVDGTVVEPNAPVSVKIELQDVTAGADRLQVVHFGADGAEKIDSQATEEAVVSFESSEFSIFGIGNVLTPLATAETDETSIEILGFGGETEIISADAPAVEEGLEVLGAYNLPNETEGVWIKADVKDGVELSSMESVVIYTIGGEMTAEAEPEEGENAEDQSSEQAEEQTNIQITELVKAGTVAELTVSEFALVKDSGYRHLSFEINVGGEEAQAEEGTEEQEEETGKIILDGMMPKLATAKAVDVTDAYAGHEYVVPEEEEQNIPEEESADEEPTEELPISAEDEPVTEESQEGVDESGETQESIEEAQEVAETEQKRITLAAFNITISYNESEYQPDEDHPITVEIRDERITGENLELWHIKDDGTEERVEEFTVEDGRVEFTATGFSAYAIVDFSATPVIFGYEKVTSLATIADQGVYICDARTDGTGFFMTNTTYNVPNTTNRTGISKVKPKSSTPPETAALYYFEKVTGTDNQFTAYCLNGSSKLYVKGSNPSGNGSLSLVSDESEATTFTVSVTSDYKFSIKDDATGKFWNMQGNDVGNGFAEWTSATPLYLYYKTGAATTDPYDLGGKSYGLMSWNGGVAGKGLMASSTNANTLDAKAMEVLVQAEDNEDRLFVPSDSDISIWTFNWVEDDLYHITTNVGGVTKYLKIDSTGLSLVDTEAEAITIQVCPGTGTHAGQLYLKANNNTLSYSGKVENGFGVGVGSAGNEWLNLVEYSDLTADYLVTYTAAKISVSDPALSNGSKIIVYARKWNPTRMRYDFYAIDHDGSLVLCYESGDTIQWIGNRVNTKLWDFVEYYLEGTTDPNYYYELYNEYSQKFIAPQVTGRQTMSSSPIGINLDGRRKGYFYSPIIAWDEAFYAYAGLKANTDDKIIESCPIGEADDFYFAILQDVEVDDDMTLAPTVDNNEHGITMKIKNFNTRDDMKTFMINDDYVQYEGVKNLLSTNLTEDGYPTVTGSGNSLGNMYSGANTVNHLFMQGTYNGSGYFTFDSTQNFATLKQTDG